MFKKLKKRKVSMKIMQRYDRTVAIKADLNIISPRMKNTSINVAIKQTTTAQMKNAAEGGSGFGLHG